MMSALHTPEMIPGMSQRRTDRARANLVSTLSRISQKFKRRGLHGMRDFGRGNKAVATRRIAS